MARPSAPETLFSSFNARNMSNEEIAYSFVPPRQFSELAQSSHSVIIGPRGSGKTTLLKMLEVPSLRLWQSQLAKTYRDNIRFIGVFIPADVLWGKILSAISTVSGSVGGSEQLGRVAFRNHCLLSLLRAIQDATQTTARSGPQIDHLRIRMNDAAEHDFSESVAKLLSLKCDILSIHGLQLALRRQLIEVEDLCIRMTEGDDVKGDVTAFLERVGPAAPLQSISGVLDALTAHCECKARWALLFDELEIAPPYIRTLLITALRSVADQRLLFKLAFTPSDQTLFGLRKRDGAFTDQDYNEIILWYENKESARSFCRALTVEMLRAARQSQLQPPHSVDVQALPRELEKIFGFSDFDSEEGPGAKGYQQGSRSLNAFIALAGKDKSFAAFLSDAGVSLNDLDALSRQERASRLRKIKPLVVLRNFFVREVSLTSASSEPRSRKTLQLYTGLYSLWAISEGNPRWLKGLLSPLLYRLMIRGEQPKAAIQAGRIASMAARFRSSLRTTAVSQDTEFKNLEQLMDAIGTYFHERLVRDAFQPEPPGSFVVDERVGDEIIEAISRAQELGAIVWLKEDGDPATTFEAKPIGRRFRLCHLLGSINGLTLTTLGEVNLSKVLTSKSDLSAQMSIFDIIEDSD